MLDEDTRQGSAPGPDHDGHGGRQTQRAGTGNDQHRHRVDQGIGHPRLRTDQAPGHEREESGHYHGGDEIGRHLVGQALDGRPATLRFAHHPDDLGQQSVAPDPLRPHDNAPRAVDGTARDTATRLLLDGDGLASHHRLVDGAVAFQDDPVDWNLLTRADAQPVS